MDCDTLLVAITPNLVTSLQDPEISIFLLVNPLVNLCSNGHLCFYLPCQNFIHSLGSLWSTEICDLHKDRLLLTTQPMTKPDFLV